MKIEIVIEGKVIVVEAEGAVSFHVRDAVIAPAPIPAPCAPVVTTPAVVVPVPAVVAPAPAFVPVDFSPADNALYAKLANLRKELSLAANIPAYAVFKDSTLREMAEKRPLDLLAFSQIGGVGKAKLDRYADAFLAVIKGVVA